NLLRIRTPWLAFGRIRVRPLGCAAHFDSGSWPRSWLLCCSCRAARKASAGRASRRAEPGNPSSRRRARSISVLRPAPGPTRREREELLQLQKQRTAEQEAVVHFWDAGATVRWNEIARDLVARHSTSHPEASRVYALLSVAQYDALVAVWAGKYTFDRRPPGD